MLWGRTRVAEISELERWLDEVRRNDVRFPTLTALAEAAQLSPSAFGRQIKAGSLGLEPLLRLALAIGVPASAVLKKAGKGDLAALIETCYGAPSPLPFVVREFAALIAAPLPDPVVRTALQQLQAFRDVLLARSGSGSGPPVTPAAVTHKPPMRRSRAK
jgi:hypothetical protein